MSSGFLDLLSGSYQRGGSTQACGTARATPPGERWNSNPVCGLGWRDLTRNQTPSSPPSLHELWMPQNKGFSNTRASSSPPHTQFLNPFYLCIPEWSIFSLISCWKTRWQPAIWSLFWDLLWLPVFQLDHSMRRWKEWHPSLYHLKQRQTSS